MSMELFSGLMRRRCLTTLCMLGVFSAASIAQNCYKRTNDSLIGPHFVKALSDSTCFAQSGPFLYHWNVKTAQPYYRVNVNINNAPAPMWPAIVDVIARDSLLLISWSESHRLLRLRNNGTVDTIRSILDTLGLLHNPKNGYIRIKKAGGDRITIYKGQPFNYVLYVCRMTEYTLLCTDSIAFETSVKPEYDAVQDTIVFMKGSEALVPDSAIFVTINEFGLITKQERVSVLGYDLFLNEIKYYHGALYYSYYNVFPAVNAHNRTKNGFSTPVQLNAGAAVVHVAFGPESVVIVNEYGGIRKYDKEYNLLCSKPFSFPYLIASASSYREKLFLLPNVDTAQTWVPDEATGAIDDVPEPQHLILEITPNPSSGSSIQLHCDPGFEDVRVYTVAGAEVLQSKLDASGRSGLNIAGLPRGIYFVTVSGNTASKTSVMIRY